MNLTGKINFKYIALFCFVLWMGGAYLYSKNYKFSNIKNSAVYEQPVQSAVETGDNVQDCCKGDSCWDFDPVARYDITAFVFGHSRRSLNDYGRIMTDLGLLWGENAAKKYYKDVDLKVLLSAYYVSWGAGDNFNLNDAANNHIITCDRAAYKKLRSIRTGDELRIKGFLVDAKISQKPYEKDPSKIITWPTSRTRADTGAGACELLYVNSSSDISILSTGPRYWLYVKIFGLYSFWFVMVFWAFVFFRGINSEIKEAEKND